MARVAQMLSCCQPSRCPSSRLCGGSLFPLQSSASASAAPARHSSVQFSGRTAPPPLAVAGSPTPSTHLFPVTANSPLPRAGGGGCRGRSPPRKVSAFSSPSKGEQKLVHEGLITESLPNGMFRVLLDNEDLILGYVSGKIRRGFIRILPGDRVRVEISRYDSTKGRIVYRLRNKGAAKEQT